MPAQAMAGPFVLPAKAMLLHKRLNQPQGAETPVCCHGRNVAGWFHFSDHLLRHQPLADASHDAR